MDSLLYLLLELKRAQLTLSQLQSARTARTEIVQTRQNRAPVSPVTSPSAVTTTSVQQTVSPAPTAQSADFRTQVEQFVFEQTNAARAQNGLAPLMSDAQAAAVARAHSQDMLTNGFFDHTNLSGCNPGCRLTQSGYVWRSYGENIHWMSGYKLSAQDTAKKIVTDWMNSPGHRANILGAFTYAGVGIAVSGDKVYSTTDYTTK